MDNNGMGAQAGSGADGGKRPHRQLRLRDRLPP